MSQPFKVLISGCGITGPALAFWLARASTSLRPIHITMIEKASSLVKLGQGIDVEGSAKEVAIRMGILDTIKARTTRELGFRCIDNNNQAYATFEMGGLTNENEIMRGDLCDVLTSAIKGSPNVKLQYSRQITGLAQIDDKVHATIAKDDGESYVEEYSAVVAADGIRSKTRNLMLDPADIDACIKPKDMFVAYFSIPAQPEDKNYSRFQHALGGRSVVIRPVTKEVSSVYLIAVGGHPELAKSMSQRDPKCRRQAWAGTLSDVNYGEFPRVVREMQRTNNFYSDQIMQVKLPRWHNGRCALVGDAAYGPAPVTGQGTSLAFLGAYVLAGELGSNLSDPARAFQEYETKFRAYVEQAQQIPFGGRAPGLLNPQTRWGIWSLQTVLWLIASTKVWKIVPDMDQRFPLPDYNFT